MEQEIINAIKYMQEFNTETMTLEAKSALKGFPKSCYDTLSSFSNKSGGIIVFGLNEGESFREEGVYDINDLQKRITSLCKSMEPVITPYIIPVIYKNKKLLGIIVSEISQNQKPCYYKPAGMQKGSYTRFGDRDDHMTDYEIYALKSYSDGIEEDRRPIKRANLSDLNKDKLFSYIVKIKKEKPNFSKFSEEKILKLSGIIDGNTSATYPTLAGTLIFSEYPQAYLPQLFVACIAIPGLAMGDVGELDQRFDDNKRVEGTIEEMLEGTLSFLMKNMKIKIIISSKTGKREDIYEYPIKALREAITNALVHRDYSNRGESMYIQVRMFHNRIEIINPGTLYGCNKIEKLGSDTIMEVRNKNIVKLLEENSEIIENRHSGIATMREEMKKMHLPEPVFEENRGNFKVTFYNSLSESASVKTTKIPNNQVYPQDNAVKIIYPQDNTLKIIRPQDNIIKNKITLRANSIIEKIYNYCLNSPKTIIEIAEFLNFKDLQNVREKYVKYMINNGFLTFTLPEKPTSRYQKYISIKKMGK